MLAERFSSPVLPRRVSANGILRFPQISIDSSHDSRPVLTLEFHRQVGPWAECHGMWILDGEVGMDQMDQP